MDNVSVSPIDMAALLTKVFLRADDKDPEVAEGILNAAGILSVEYDYDTGDYVLSGRIWPDEFNHLKDEDDG